MVPRLIQLLEERHSSTQAVGKYLEVNPTLPTQQQDTARVFADAAITLLEANPEDSPELTAGLRKLLEAKDCFVRASLGL